MKKIIPPPIQFIITGGTIDSGYDGIQDTVVPNKVSIIPSYLKLLKLYNQYEYTEICVKVCLKDSRGLTESDLKKILETIEKSKFKRFIITHGTYTMPDTARYLKANLKRKDATVILTGAMIPMYNMTNSDGPFNLGFSIASFDHLKKGIYVCMNGRIFEPEEVLKTLYNGRFSSIFGEK